jgi:hypothetical protein
MIASVIPSLNVKRVGNLVRVEVLTQLVGKSPGVPTQSPRAQENGVVAPCHSSHFNPYLRRRHSLPPYADSIRARVDSARFRPEMRASLLKLDQSMIFVIDITKPLGCLVVLCIAPNVTYTSRDRHRKVEPEL